MRQLNKIDVLWICMQNECNANWIAEIEVNGSKSRGNGDIMQPIDLKGPWMKQLCYYIWQPNLFSWNGCLEAMGFPSNQTWTQVPLHQQEIYLWQRTSDMIGTVYPNSPFSTNHIIMCSRSSPQDTMGTQAKECSWPSWSYACLSSSNS